MIRGARPIDLLRCLALILIAAAVAGCGPDVEIAASLATDPPRRVAILPLEAPDTERRGSDEMFLIRRLLHDHWSNLPFRVLTLDVTDRALAASGIDTIETLDATTADRLAAILEVDAVVRGQVESFSNIAPLVAYRRAMSGTLRLEEGRPDRAAGQVLWRADHTEQTWGGPLLESGQVIKGIRNQIANSSALAFYRTADVFTRRLVETMPDLPALAAPTPPSLDPASIVVEPSRPGPLGRDDRIAVRFGGDPGHEATFAIGIYRTRIPMTEVRPGRYAGTYFVQAGDGTRGAPIRISLRDRFGEATSATAAGTSIDLAARPPRPPGDLRIARRGPAVHLTWKAEAPPGSPRPPEPSPAPVRFVVHRATGHPRRFVPIGRTDGATEFVDPSPPSDRPLFYQVAGISGEGLASLPAPWVEAGSSEGAE